MSVDGWSLVRVVHVLAAMGWVGGQRLLTAVVLPVLRRQLDPVARGPLVHAIARRFAFAANVALLPSLVVTGEGRMDAQSAYGKLTQAVAHAARDAGVPVVAVAGSLGSGYDVMRDAGIRVFAALASTDAERAAAMRDPLPAIEAAAARAVEQWRREADTV